MEGYISTTTATTTTLSIRSHSICQILMLLLLSRSLPPTAALLPTVISLAVQLAPPRVLTWAVGLESSAIRLHARARSRGLYVVKRLRLRSQLPPTRLF